MQGLKMICGELGTLVVFVFVIKPCIWSLGVPEKGSHFDLITIVKGIHNVLKVW